MDEKDCVYPNKENRNCGYPNCFSCRYHVEKIIPATKIHDKLFKRMNKIAPDRLEDIVQSLEQMKML